MNYRAARLAMVESQIRPNGVRDPDILNAFATVPRENFVQQAQKRLAYRDEPLPVAMPGGASPARSLLPPMVLAKLIQLGAPFPSARALDIGGVTGYSAAILAQLCAEVHALENSDALTKEMANCLVSAGVETVHIHTGALPDGVPDAQPFDVILINGAVPGEPRELLAQLAEGGRLVTILGTGWHGRGYYYTKSGESVSGKAAFDAGAEILPGFESKPHFVF